MLRGSGPITDLLRHSSGNLYILLAKNIIFNKSLQAGPLFFPEGLLKKLKGGLKLGGIWI
jgi:hypothetical protein